MSVERPDPITTRQYGAFNPILTQEIYFVVGIIGTCVYTPLFLSRSASLKRIGSALTQIYWHLLCHMMFYAGFIWTYIGAVIGTRFIGHQVGSRVCDIAAIYNQFFITGLIVWYLMLSLDLLVVIINPYIPAGMRTFLYHICAWSLSLGSAIFLYNADAYGLNSINICWIHRTASYRSINPFNWDMFFWPAIVAFAVSVVVLMIASFKLLRRQRDFTHRNKRRVVLHHLRFLLAFGLSGTCFGALYYADYQRHFASKKLQVAFAIFLALHPVINVVMFLISSERFSVKMEEVEPLHRTLRSDLMYYTRTGICNSSKDTEEDLRVSPTRILINTKEAYLERKRTAPNFMWGQQRYYVKLGFTDYAPVVFRDIREICGISSHEFESAFSKDQELTEFGSLGKSGMLFYYTATRRFMVKTMLYEEHKFLMEILARYHAYLQDNPESLLCRYLGCHSMQLPVGWNQIFFVAMENVLPSSAITEKYDLKGIMDNRRPTDDGQDPSGRSLLFEKEFLCNKSALRVHSRSRVKLLQQISADCNFLKELGIIDYSFLVGIENVDPLMKERLDPTRLPRNAVLSKDGDKIYYLGFVDLLQRYDFRWKVQHLLLRCIKSKRDLTAVPPADYALRFLTFMHTHLFEKTGETVTPGSKFTHYGSFRV